MSSAERSSLRKERGLPLPISQPTRNMWAKGRNLRKPTEEETNCDASKDTCSVRQFNFIPGMFSLHESYCCPRRFLV
jgi:hypothetical protein